MPSNFCHASQESNVEFIHGNNLVNVHFFICFFSIRTKLPGDSTSGPISVAGYQYYVMFNFRQWPFLTLFQCWPPDSKVQKNKIKISYPFVGTGGVQTELRDICTGYIKCTEDVLGSAGLFCHLFGSFDQSPPILSFPMEAIWIISVLFGATSAYTSVPEPFRNTRPVHDYFK